MVNEKDLPCRYRLNTTVDVLGSEWTVKILTPEEDPRLTTTTGFVDRTSRLIAIQDVAPDCTLDDPMKILFETVRHELVHAFMFESGLGDNVEHKDLGQEETWVDWFAIQMPKIWRAATAVCTRIKRCADCRESCEGCRPNNGQTEFVIRTEYVIQERQDDGSWDTIGATYDREKAEQEVTSLEKRNGAKYRLIQSKGG